MTGAFAAVQAEYASHNVAVFPVEAAKKKPAIRNPHRIGLKASKQLAQKFPDSDALGFWAGSRNRLTVLDIDVPGTTGERMLAERLDRHGRSPLIVRTASGKFHAYYRGNGENRVIRDEHEKVDILGKGLVIAPPSRVIHGSYEIIEGSLDDLDRLPIMRGVRLAHAPPSVQRGRIASGKRNNALFEHCMRQARSCDTVDDLLDVAQTFNIDAFIEPLPGPEVIKTANSAWCYTENGQNRFGQHGAWFPTDEANHLIFTDKDVLVLLVYLRANNGPNATFMAADGLYRNIGWPLKRLRKARKKLIELGYIKLVRSHSPTNGPALYRWCSMRGQN